MASSKPLQESKGFKKDVDEVCFFNKDGRLLTLITTVDDADEEFEMPKEVGDFLKAAETNTHVARKFYRMCMEYVVKHAANPQNESSGNVDAEDIANTALHRLLQVEFVTFSKSTVYGAEPNDGLILNVKHCSEAE